METTSLVSALGPSCVIYHLNFSDPGARPGCSNVPGKKIKFPSFQLERTRSDIQSDLLDMEWRLDHEGKEFHHFDDFCQLYRAEILNLNRTLVTFCQLYRAEILNLNRTLVTFCHFTLYPQMMYVTSSYSVSYYYFTM